ncbi:hypothetical protein ACIA8O_21510 [Kitasatospora sp. NPDC051853]|uniref:hypothetical protein n=1 Tax=Kitasatospora sp. NPDC051853 TaxID=3364058 RepID=UPI0037B4CA85
MSRTVRTTPHRLRSSESGPVSVTRYDLRHPEAELTRAAREGRRPAPVRTLRRLRSWNWIRLDGRTGGFACEIATAERRGRLRARLEAERLRALHRASHPLDGADVPPVRHRHDALWHA